MDRVADWCRVKSGGSCRWDDSLDGLRAALPTELDVEVLEVEVD